MKTILEAPCDHAGCQRVGTVSEIEIKDGGTVKFCRACLAVAIGSHNVVGEDNEKS